MTYSANTLLYPWEGDLDQFRRLGQSLLKLRRGVTLNQPYLLYLTIFDIFDLFRDMLYLTYSTIFDPFGSIGASIPKLRRVLFYYSTIFGYIGSTVTSIPKLRGGLFY